MSSVPERRSDSRIRSIARSADFQAGLVFVLMALLGLFLSRQLRMGTAMRMGPGYLPTMISYLLLSLGLGTAAFAALRPGAATAPWYLRPLLTIVAALLVFSLGVDRLGLFVTCCLVVVVASLATRESRWMEVLLVAVGLATFSTLLFVKALGLAIPAWPQISVF